MAIDYGRKANIRIAAAVLVALLMAATAFTYLSYSAAFTPVDTVIVSSDRAGLVMERDAKVKYLGVQVGKVTSIDYDGDKARLTLKVLRDQMGLIPSNITVRIASNTVFGGKSVDFLEPANPSARHLAPDTTLQAADVAVEANTLFESLVNTLHKINPVELNATLTAISDGLRTHGDDAGQSISGLNSLMAKLNPSLPTLQSDVQRLGQTSDIYAQAAPDLVTILDNLPTISGTIVDQRENLQATLLAATGVATAGTDTLAPAETALVNAIQRLRAPLNVMKEYSPQLGCVLQALAEAYAKFGPQVGGSVAGLFLSANFKPGSAPYTYPESLPIVNASGGPNCRGLPNLPTKQGNGSWYHPQFLVTDNAYIPYQPNTELQFDPPNTLQFLFNGAFAERDDF
ncbi:MCE family protein [Mycobacteroides abscessus]|uniref:MCE family protein n=1 Tax=Mycobacteroides abscessus TaxID=36809 RepID=UPI00092C2D80|nr:MCE family protein [Mycobacteroides abscessus]MDO3333944.1 MCE family protein [Mycobacteroides abscessus subsp. bolletii]QSM86848.1 MCE family protein [Mycobacteroides abscessus subsp. bolletii]SIB90767.1 Virulence factor Mce family protein [Mycobacteroides abscessus subsp. bolletii]SKS86804.1 Virulence factor Mce family protein [Mycobacteroides abscessus subsp. bolletii]SKT10482.1 Virulence factor Mce family protein [Mycobacteroides abscessus subsp. bolletii]